MSTEVSRIEQQWKDRNSFTGVEPLQPGLPLPAVGTLRLRFTNAYISKTHCHRD